MRQGSDPAPHGTRGLSEEAAEAPAARRPHPAAAVRGLFDDGLAGCLAGTAFLLAWLPLVQAVGSTDWSAGFAAAAPPCSFFVAMALAMFFSQGGLDEADVPARAVAAASLAACAAGCLVELASGPGILADTAALGLLGFSSTLAGRLWFRHAVRQQAATHAVCVTVGLLVWSCAAFALQRAGMGANLLAAFAGTALSLASSLHAGRSARSVPERIAGKSEKDGEGAPAGTSGVQAQRTPGARHGPASCSGSRWGGSSYATCPRFSASACSLRPCSPCS